MLKTIIKLIVSLYIAVCIAFTTSIIFNCAFNPTATCKVTFIASEGGKNER